MLLIRSAPVVILISLIFSAGPLAGKNSSWKDSQGATIRGESTEVLGPWALLKTGPVSGRRVFLRGFSPADCRRFYDEIARRPVVAGNWAGAQGVATREVVGHTLQLKGKTLVPADLAGMHEPQLLLVLIVRTRMANHGKW